MRTVSGLVSCAFVLKKISEKRKKESALEIKLFFILFIAGTKDRKLAMKNKVLLQRIIYQTLQMKSIIFCLFLADAL